MKKGYLVLTSLVLALTIVLTVVLIERAQTEVACTGIEIRVLYEGTSNPVVDTPVRLYALDIPPNGGPWTINTDALGDSYFDLQNWPHECEEEPPQCCPADHNAGDYKARALA